MYLLQAAAWNVMLLFPSDRIPETADTSLNHFPIDAFGSAGNRSDFQGGFPEVLSGPNDVLCRLQDIFECALRRPGLYTDLPIHPPPSVFVSGVSGCGPFIDCHFVLL